MNRPTLIILTLVILLVVVTTWLSQKSEQPKSTTKPVTEGIADYFIRDFEGTVTGKNGTPVQLMKADYLVHYTDSDLTELTQPALTVYRDHGDQWLVKAEQGLMEGEGDEVQLSGEVTLTQRSKKQPVVLRTDTLRLYPDRHYAETDSAVDIRAPSGRIRGVGMKVYGEEDRVILLSAIRGTYEATSR
jgi:lipopolysaccharide export system protein LptC